MIHLPPEHTQPELTAQPAAQRFDDVPAWILRRNESVYRSAASIRNEGWRRWLGGGNGPVPLLAVVRTPRATSGRIRSLAQQ
jgi:hypothetical protein